MKSSKSLYLILFGLMFFPVLDVSGHFINFVEFYIYILFAMNLKKIIPLSTVKIFIVYMFLFFLTVVFTALVANKPINNYDIFILRNCAQLICLLSVLYLYISEISQKSSTTELKNIILKSFYILSLPALLVYLQRMNILEAREIVKLLYKPQFFFLEADVFSEFRYTSVFKDFFTAGVYFIILNTSIYYFYLTADLKKTEKIKLVLLMVFVYVSQLFVSRSSLVLIPFNLLLVTLFGTRSSLLTSFKRLLVMVLVTTPIFILILNTLIDLNYVKSEWVSEGLNILVNQSEDNGSSSFQVMQQWNQNFFQYVLNHPEILFSPNHVYDLRETTPGSLYTDGFYPQEIYRYGIYGILSYLYLVLFLFKDFVKVHRGLLIIIFSFVLLNYKGGNVFFMPKNIYLYAFVIAAFRIMDDLNQKQRVGDL